MAGCIHVEETIDLKSDGSGRLLLSYGMSKEHVAALESAMSEADALEPDASDEANPFNFDEESIREHFSELETEGVKLASVHSEEKDDWKYVHLDITFDSIEGLAKTPLFSDRQLSLTRNDTGQYVFKQARDAETSSEKLADTENPEIEALVRKMMAGFKVVVQVKTPGPIAESSSTDLEGRTATWTFDIDKDWKAFAELDQLDMWVVFEDEGAEAQQNPKKDTVAP